MKKIGLVLLLLVGLSGPNKSAFAGDDWEYWGSFEITGAIDDNLDLKVKLEPRYNDDFSDHYYTSIEIGFDWKIEDWFILSPYYQHVDEKKSGDWQVENRPHLDTTFKWKLIGLNFSDRNRLEYRIKEDDEFFRYRNKLTVKLPKFTCLEIQPYLAEEPFYDFNENKLNKNRIYAGLDFKIVEHLKAGIYYIFQSSKKAGVWTNVNIMRTTIKYNF